MNIQKNLNFTALHKRMAFRFWFNMMMLVGFVISFMWILQVRLFEQNYVEAILAETQDRLQSAMRSLAMEDLMNDKNLFSDFSRIVNGDMILMNRQGKLLQMYSLGHPVNLLEQKEEQVVLDMLKTREGFRKCLDGSPYRYVDYHGNSVTGYELGFPVTYNGEPCYMILHRTLMLDTVLDMNHKQLVFLSILLTAIASFFAALLTRQFTKPISQIQNTVEQLARHDFSARPKLDRQDELGRLSRSVDELGQALQQIDVLRREVIANVSHELRSPLAVISGYAEMVRDITWRDENQRNEDLNLIINESRRMSEMVTDILDYSQLQAGYIQLKKDWYNLYEILESEISACRQSAAEHQILLKLDCHQADIPLEVDALKISQVVRNLLYNAINHTQEQKTIIVRTENQAGGILVSVCNPGDPIPEAERKLVWERYQRSQHQSGRRLGTGIGLSIVSTILQAHEMKYGVECRKGWVNFWFLCPAAKE